MGCPRSTAVLALGLAALVLAVFGQTVGFDFVRFDDDGYVTENATLLEGLGPETFRWAWTTGAMSNWHPLTWLSYLLDFELHGLDPAGYHATNVALHLLNTLLLFGWLRSATGSEGRSALVAALFAVHPLHVESVAWISERKDVLSGLFGISSLWAYLAYARRGGAWRYAAVAMLLALGLASKPMLVTFPLLYLLLDLWPLGRTGLASPASAASGGPRTRSPGFLVLEKLPLLALSAAASVLAYRAQRGSGTVLQEAVLPLGVRLANAVHAYAWYVGKALWPSGLCAHYPHPFLPDRGGEALGAGLVVACALLLVLLTGAALLAARRLPALVVGWLWFLGTLVPVIGLVQVSLQGHADRYTYLPLIGLSIAGVWSGAALARRWAGSSRRAGAWCAAVATGLVLASSAAAWQQTRTWRDSETLFRHALDVAPSNGLVHTQLGLALAASGRDAAAIPHFDRALALAPDWPLPRFHRGISHLRGGSLEASERDFRIAVALTPDVTEVRTNLAGVLVLRGRSDEAVEHYRRVLEARPSDRAVRLALGRALQLSERPDEAIAVYREGLKIEPAQADLHYALSGALGATGRYQQAIAHLERVLAARPDDHRARQRLAMARSQSRRPGP
jgi:tetratricopeptide (TPR) repeat protein